MDTKKLKTELWPFLTILRNIPFTLRKIVPNYIKSRNSYFLSHLYLLYVSCSTHLVVLWPFHKSSWRAGITSTQLWAIHA